MKEPYEKGVAIRSASSLALGIARYTAKRRQRIGGVGIQLRKDAIRTPTSLQCTEGNMNRRDSASSCSVRRSRRPQTRLETSCTRTGRPRRHLRLNQAAGRRLAKQKYVAPYFFAGIYIGLGENDRAIEYLEKCYEEHSHWLIYLHIDPSMDVLRDNQGFQGLLRRVGLPALTTATPV